MTKKSTPQPPKWADKILSWYCSDYYFEEVQGDLHEWFFMRVEHQGPRVARLMYFLDVIRYFRSFRIKNAKRIGQNSNITSMKQIIKLTYRNFRKDKLSGFLKFLNLTIGLTVFLLTFIYARYELSYDSYYNNSENIYRVGQSLNASPWAASPIGMGPYAKENVSGVTNMTRFFRIYSTWIKRDDQIFTERRGFHVDEQVFEMFDYEVITGDLEKALVPPDGIVLTEGLAIKYFGRTDIVGEQLELEVDRGRTRRVTAVIQNIPEQTHLKFDYLLPLNVFGDRFLSAWRNWATYTYVEVAPEADLGAMKAALEAEYIKQYRRSGDGFQVQIVPIEKIHLYTNHEKELADNGNINYIYVLFSIAFFVLLISSINYINLSVVKGLDRSKEVGLRKTVGASRRQIIVQFMGENFLLLLFSGVMCLLLLAAIGPVFANFSGLNLPLNVFDDLSILIPLAIVIAVLEIACGIYPALVLSGFRPSQVLKSGGGTMTTKVGKLGMLRKGLIVIQFVISMVLVTSSFVIYNQLSYMQSENPGFAKDQIITIELNRSLRQKMDVFKRSLENITGVKKVSGASAVPGVRFVVEGVAEVGQEDQYSTRLLLADENYVETYGINITKGKNFIQNVADAPVEFLLNEAAAAHMFPDRDPLNQMITWGRDTGKVVGVVEDFNFQSLHFEVEPLVINSNSRYNYLSLRFEPSAYEAVRNGIEAVKTDVYPDLPSIEYRLLSDSFDSLYQAEIKLKSIVWVFCVVSVTLTLSGIFGMATYMAKQRFKEIAIRKVLGSNISNLLNLLSRDFAILLIVALLVAAPAGVWLSNWWLQGFANKVGVGAGIFVVSSLLIAALVMGSACYVTLKAASMNPVDALKNE